MCALSNHIREKPDWWEKINDETIVRKWREEASQQAGDAKKPEWTLTPAMVHSTSHRWNHHPNSDISRSTMYSKNFGGMRTCVTGKLG